MKALIGTKLGMTQVIGEDGTARAVTLIQAGPCMVTQVKSQEKDGYAAVQIGYGKAKKLNKPMAAHLKASKASPQRLKEVRTEEIGEVKVGDIWDVELFQLGDSVNVTGTSKGKGFAGTVKRHNFRTSKETHGGNGSVRKPGSIGSMYPQKVFKGKRMAGRMGHERVTVKNLKVAYIDKTNNLLGVTGAVPGPRKGTVMLGGVV